MKSTDTVFSRTRAGITSSAKALEGYVAGGPAEVAATTDELLADATAAQKRFITTGVISAHRTAVWLAATVRDVAHQRASRRALLKHGVSTAITSRWTLLA